jgi:SHS2 domain-containing protein
VKGWRYHAPAVEVKGATLTEFSVAQWPDGELRAQRVLDVRRRRALD